MSNLLRVWSRFSTVAKKSGDIRNFLIMDMPKNLKDHVINLYIEYFIKHEATCKAAGVPKNLKALEEVRAYLLKMAEKPGFHTMICCKDNGDEQIKDVVGASMMTLLLKGHPEPDEWTCETQEIKKLLEIFSTFAAHFNEMKVFNLDRYFSDRGAFVRPEFRGLGIAQEICKARRIISKEHGIPIHGGWFTSAGTQKSAARDGWETIIEIPFQDLARKHGVTFEDNTPFCKYMLARIDTNSQLKTSSSLSQPKEVHYGS